MKKLFTKIATLSVGLAMAAGVGLALGQQRVERVEAATGAVGSKMTSANFEDGATVVLRKAESDVYCSSVASGWFTTSTGYANALEFIVGGTASSFSLKNASTGKYVNNSSQKTFAYVDDETKQFSIDANGVISNSNIANNTYKHNDGSNGFRSYAASNTGDPGYFYFVQATDPVINLSTASLNMHTGDEPVDVTVSYNNIFTAKPVITCSASTHVSTTVNDLVVSVTPVSDGEETITITATNDTQVATAQLSVKVTTVAYEGTFVLTSNNSTTYTVLDSSNFFDNVDNSGAFTVLLPDGNVRVASGSGDNRTTIMFGSATVASTFTLTAKEGRVITSVKVNAYETDEKAVTLTIGGYPLPVAASSAATDYTGYPMSQSVTLSTTTRLWIKSITIVVEKPTDGAGVLATEMAQAFLDATAAECAALNVTQGTWNALKGSFQALETSYPQEAAYVKAAGEDAPAIARS